MPAAHHTYIDVLRESQRTRLPPLVVVILLLVKQHLTVVRLRHIVRGLRRSFALRFPQPILECLQLCNCLRQERTVGTAYGTNTTKYTKMYTRTHTDTHMHLSTHTNNTHHKQKHTRTAHTWRACVPPAHGHRAFVFAERTSLASAPMVKAD
jgi:hypothetical protein